MPNSRAGSVAGAERRARNVSDGLHAASTTDAANSVLTVACKIEDLVDCTETAQVTAQVTARVRRE